MILLPAIDIYDGKVVRLFKGDYKEMTVYSDDPLSIAKTFKDAGATQLHVVDLQGAKSGATDNFSSVLALIEKSDLKVEIGGGIRTAETVKKYIDAGAERVVLGTAAVNDPVFLESSLSLYGEHIAVGADIKDGFVAVKGWTELSAETCDAFCRRIQSLGAKYVICTDVSRDGVLSGPNVDLYRFLVSSFSMNFIASGGVATIENIATLRSLGLWGAILGKALYEKKISIYDAIKECERC